MKNKVTVAILALIFIVYTLVVNLFPQVTQWDVSTIIKVQENLKDYPLCAAQLAGLWLYILFLVIPVAIGTVYFFRKYLLIDMILFASSPIVAYVFSHIVKEIVHRPRPPLELQLGYHSNSCSYVSTHTLTTTVLWCLTVYYLIKYCKNKFIKYFSIGLGTFWIIFEGFSRIWCGVHNPTDVVGGYLLAAIIVLVYIDVIKLIGGK